MAGPAGDATFLEEIQVLPQRHGPVRLATRLLAVLVRGRPSLCSANCGVLYGRHHSLRHTVLPRRDMAQCRIRQISSKRPCVKPIPLVPTIPHWLSQLELSAFGRALPRRSRHNLLLCHELGSSTVLLA